MSATQAPRRFINNFDLMRLLAASAVVLGHSYILSSGDASQEPLHRFFGLDLGRVAVDIFFVMSGFLVTGSLLRRDCLKSFWIARFLRVFPAMIVMSLLTVFILGPLVSTLPLTEYFGSAATWLHLLKNSTLFAGVSFVLPGVFAGTPYPEAVNGSLWSLPLELRMYLLLAGCWFLAGRLNRDVQVWARRMFPAIMLLGTLITLYCYLTGKIPNHHPRLAAMFFAGATARLYADRLRWSGLLAAGLTILLLLVSIFMRNWLESLYVLLMPYCILYVAHRQIPLVSDLRLPDYSYGIYIYSFPLQQLFVQLLPGIQPLPMFALSFSATLVLAALSWYLVEKPAMRLKRS